MICERFRADTLAQPVGHRARFGRRSVGEHDGEFIAAEPGDPVSLKTQAATDATAELFQYLISGLMPVSGPPGELTTDSGTLPSESTFEAGPSIGSPA